MIRSVPISLSLATASKKRRLQAVVREVRSAVNHYCQSLWDDQGALDYDTVHRYRGGSLSMRHRESALKMALGMVGALKSLSSNHKISVPVSSNAVTLSSLVCKVEEGKGSFDYVLKVSSLKTCRPVVIPFKGHRRLNHWLGKGAKIKQGAILDLKRSRAILWLDVPVEKGTQSDRILGVDIGLNKMLATSDGKFLGTEFKDVCNRVRRKKPGSKSRHRAAVTRGQFINRICKLLPWDDMGCLRMEELKGLKIGKKKSRGKSFRKAMAPWTYRQVGARLAQLAQENRVRLELVNPKNTSRMCPRCGLVSRENRVGEMFKCVGCNYTADADYVGALNISRRPPGNSS